MKELCIIYKIPEKLAKELEKKGINFNAVVNKISVGDYKLGEPERCIVRPIQ